MQTFMRLLIIEDSEDDAALLAPASAAGGIRDQVRARGLGRGSGASSQQKLGHRYLGPFHAALLGDGSSENGESDETPTFRSFSCLAPLEKMRPRTL